MNYPFQCLELVNLKLSFTCRYFFILNLGIKRQNFMLIQNMMRKNAKKTQQVQKSKVYSLCSYMLKFFVESYY
jgi:hypothetical protein